MPDCLNQKVKSIGHEVSTAKLCHQRSWSIYTSTLADEHANPIEGIPEHLTTIIFTQEAKKTKATARIQFTSAEALKVALDMGMLQG